MNDSIVTTSDLWPRISNIFGLDATAKNIKSFELIIKEPIPIIRIELLMRNGEAMAFESVMQEYGLHRILGAGETAPLREVA